MSSMREGKRTHCKAFVTDLKYAESVVLKKHASLFQKVTIVVPKSPEEQLWQVDAILGGLPRWHLRGFPSVGNGTPRRRRRIPARHRRLQPRGRGDPSCPPRWPALPNLVRTSKTGQMLCPVSAPRIGDGTAVGARLLRAGSGYQERPPLRGGHRTLFHQYLTSFSPFFSLHSGRALGYCAGEAVSLPILVTVQKVLFSRSAFSWELPPALGVDGI